MNCYAKRLECDQLAGAFVGRGAVRKREQAPRTPNASRSGLRPSGAALIATLRFSGARPDGINPIKTDATCRHPGIEHGTSLLLACRKPDVGVLVACASLVFR
jgi:hypothetical protein